MRCFTSIFLIFLLYVAAGCSLSLPGQYEPADAAAEPDTGEDLLVDTNPDPGDVPVDGEDVCPPGQTLCSGVCVDTSTNPSHCGWCGNACPSDRDCVAGICVCRSPLVECGGECVDLRSDHENCGECGRACGPEEVCVAGSCATECPEGLEDCGGSCVDTDTDPSHCGECFHECPGAEGAYPVCVDGECGLECMPGRWDLDGIPGCEYECTFTSEEELCNGLDDNCNGEVDEGFECSPGVARTCTTDCSTPGFQSCTSSCTWSRCCASDEVCGNDCDDDCNGAADDGCPETVPNDTCASPTDVTPGGRFEGNTSPAGDDSDGSCVGGRGGRDVYFSFTLTGSSDVFISSYGSEFDTVLYVSGTCGGSDLACSDDLDLGIVLQSHVQLVNLGAGTYYITLDGFDASAHGSYVLDVYISPADIQGDRCGRPIMFESPGASGHLCSWDHQYTGSCNSRTKPDGVYFVVVTPSMGTVTTTFSTCNDATTFDSVLYLREVCTDGSTEAACDDDAGWAACPLNSRLSVMDVSLSPGVYYLFVDGGYNACNSGSDLGPFYVSVTGM